ncbi:MAG: SDR family oxidoreductase [Alphaproteobacteria bacterium]|nr:SDR family oxidoreductase [Alphaproteobacteria bacterium]
MPRPKSAPHLFCFGLGFSARTLADRVLARGGTVAGTCRSADKQAALRGAGIEAHIFDGTAPLADAAALFSDATHVLSSVPPDADGDPVLRYHFEDLAEASDVDWIGYLSTTGVYGDRGGGWVDEGSALEPTGARGARRVTAEAQWQDLWWDHDRPVHLFRLAGIYGPGRNALETVRQGRARRIHKAGQVFSRIAVEDIAETLARSMADPNPGRVYNVCDDDPAPPDEVIAFACELLDVAPPPLIPFHQAEAEMSPMALSFYRDNKRVRNDRIKDELGVVLRYPDYRTGLRALLADYADN